MNDSACTCGDFQSQKFPCLHALAVCKKLKINPLMYVDECYTFERYCKTYAATFSPVPELGRKLPEFRDCLRQSFLRHQHKTTPKTNKRKS